jgi:HAD superfamily hydrolase (TIGR01509 family)
MGGGKHQLELLCFLRRQVQRTVTPYVAFNTLNQSESGTVGGVQSMDGIVLLGRLLHRHAAGDFQPVRMVGHRGVRISTFEAGFHDFAQGWSAVTPLRVHLQIALVVLNRRRRKRLIVQDSQNFRSTEKMGSQEPPSQDVRPSLADGDGRFDGSRHPRVEHFENDPLRSRADPGDLRERAIPPQKRSQRLFKAENDGGGALVPEHFLLRRLRECQIAEQAADYRVHIHPCTQFARHTPSYGMSQMRFKALLFDIDGTLIDSNGAHTEAWTQALCEHGVNVGVDQIRRMIGMGGDKILPAVAHVSDDSEVGQAITRRKKQIFNTLLPGLRSTPGARPLVDYLREQQVGLIIATSADDREMTALLQRAGVDDLIPTRASRDDAGASKPDPDIVQAALARSGARPNETALIGDTPYDIEAADRAGIEAIALRCGGYWTDNDLRGATKIFDDPEALLAYWRRP